MSGSSGKFLVLVGTLAVLCSIGDGAFAQEPGWDSRIIVPREERAILQATPIEQRPYRPLHFYGNTVRRSYYRGNPLPLSRDYLATGAMLGGGNPISLLPNSVFRPRRRQ